MPLPFKTRQRIAHIDVLWDMAFSLTMTRWCDPATNPGRDMGITAMPSSNRIRARGYTLIDTDCDCEVTASGILHVNGDFNGKLSSRGHQEIIISGNLGKDAQIDAADDVSVYIGGSALGRIDLQGMTKVWIDGTFLGVMFTGTPSTHLYVSGDFNGTIGTTDPALLYINVQGFASNAAISKVSDIGYTVFNASVGASDVEPGLYPFDGGHKKKASGGNSYSRWVVLSRNTNNAEPRNAPESSS